MKLITLSTISLILAATSLKAEEVKVNQQNLEPINISVENGYFTVIELENPILNQININTKSLQVTKLNNKSIVVSLYDSNVPNNLGKVLINDSSCNTYSLNFVHGEQKKDVVVHITNTNKQKKCDVAYKDRPNGVRTITYSKNMLNAATK